MGIREDILANALRTDIDEAEKLVIHKSLINQYYISGVSSVKGIAFLHAGHTYTINFVKALDDGSLVIDFTKDGKIHTLYTHYLGPADSPVDAIKEMLEIF